MIPMSLRISIIEMVTGYYLSLWPKRPQMYYQPHQSRQGTLDPEPP